MQPVEHFEALEPVSACDQGSNSSIRQIGPSRRPMRGASSRDAQGVRMVPMKTSPASEALGEATATSPCLISFSRTNAVPSVDGNHNVGSLDDRVGGMAFARPRSTTASLVIDAVTIAPPISILTCEVVAPFTTSTMVPMSWLRALSSCSFPADLTTGCYRRPNVVQTW